MEKERIRLIVGCIILIIVNIALVAFEIMSQEFSIAWIISDALLIICPIDVLIGLLQ